jgi:hypothetical protein
MKLTAATLKLTAAAMKLKAGTMKLTATTVKLMDAVSNFTAAGSKRKCAIARLSRAVVDGLARIPGHAVTVAALVLAPVSFEARRLASRGGAATSI